MNIPLERLVAGMIASLRVEVIPKITDSYARGQAVGVIDTLNSIGHRIEWRREPVLAAVHAKLDLLEAVAEGLGETPPARPAPPESLSTAALEAERNRLDAAICAALHAAHARGDAAGRAALVLLLAHIHGELEQEKANIRKPLFAEIASGSGG